MKNQNKFIRFGIIAAVIFTVINLLVYNDVASLLEIETSLLEYLGNKIAANTVIAPLPFKLLGFLYTAPLNTMALRLISALPLLWTLAALYYLGRKILGDAPALLGTLVTASSFLLLGLGKLVVADNWLVLAQTLQFLSLIYFLKQPKLPWLLLSCVSLILSATIAPLSTLLYTPVLLGFYGILHPNGKNILDLKFIIPMLLLLGMIVMSGSLSWETPGLIMTWSSLGIGKYLLAQSIGVLPWLAFFIAAFWDSFNKIKKKEELSIIYLGALLACIVSGSATLQVILALMAARHCLYYFHKNYPYRRLVSGLLVVYIIVSFFILFAMIMTVGYADFRGTGYRAVIAFAIAYWSGSLVAVTGLLSKNKRNVIGGLGFATIMGFLMLVLNGLPLLESRRGWQKTMVSSAVQYKSPSTDKLIVLTDSVELDTKIANIYGDSYGIAVEASTTSELNQINRGKDDLVVLPKSFYQADNKLLLLRDSILVNHDLMNAKREVYYIGKWN